MTINAQVLFAKQRMHLNKKNLTNVAEMMMVGLASLLHFRMVTICQTVTLTPHRALPQKQQN